MEHQRVRKIRCIAIEDEPLALELIESYIGKISYLEYTGGFSDGIQALNCVNFDQVDLMFLDINMPEISGMDFFKALPNPPKVVFITAYDQFAVQGFDLQAVDYLLKPVAFSRFLLACERVNGQLMLEDANTSKDEKEQLNYIFVKSEHNIVKISFENISFIEGYKDYIKIYENDAKPTLTLTTIKSMEDVLPRNQFIRVHKSFIISIQKIKSVRNGKILVRDKHIPIGDSYREEFNLRVMKGKV